MMAGLPQDSTPSPWTKVTELMEQLQVQTKLAATQAEQLQELQEKLAAAQAHAQATSQAQGVSGYPRILELEKTPTSGVTTDEDSRLEEIKETNAADFLLSNSKFHDCYLTVGNPAIDNVERIGVSSVYLIANSPVLRSILCSSEPQNDSIPTTYISDVSPATFKLMLRFIYGGKLPNMTAIETALLALCADKYQIPRLVQKTLKRLKPTSAEDVFPALICVTYTSFPDLEVDVCKIIQQETDKVVENDDFLKLDEACVIFILKQDTLKICEVKLWKHVVRWAEHQVEMNPAKTMRECLSKMLQHVRFLTFTLEELTEHVLPTKILSSDEFVDLLLTVTNKQPLQSSFLCDDRNYRHNNQEEVETLLKNKDDFNTPVFDKICSFRAYDHFEVKREDLLTQWSSLIIIPHKSLEIESFVCKARSDNPCLLRYNSNERYKYTCTVRAARTVIGLKYRYEQNVEGSALCDDDIIIPLQFNSGQPTIINPDERWSFHLKWDTPHPVHDFVTCPKTTETVFGYQNYLVSEDIRVAYNNPFHVLKVLYKTQ